MLDARIEEWPLKHPFRITGYTFTHADVIVAEVTFDGLTGRGEAMGVYYLGDTPKRAKEQLDALAPVLERQVSRNELLQLLPAGGARNALDAALWDLESKQQRKPVWQMTKLKRWKPLRTTMTLGADAPEVMAKRAAELEAFDALKLKLDGTYADAERVAAVRAARPDVWLAVDANQGFTRESLDALMPTLIASGVELLEQPFPRDRNDLLDGLRSPIAVAADESALDVGDLENLAGRVNVINIKLDKCGGLTRGLQMHAAAQKLGMKTMVGCMIGTSLAMAPAFVLGQLCDIVDLDAPMSLAHDREPSAEYRGGRITIPESLWGAPA